MCAEWGRLLCNLEHLFGYESLYYTAKYGYGSHFMICIKVTTFRERPLTYTLSWRTSKTSINAHCPPDEKEPKALHGQMYGLARLKENCVWFGESVTRLSQLNSRNCSCNISFETHGQNLINLNIMFPTTSSQPLGVAISKSVDIKKQLNTWHLSCFVFRNTRT